MSGLQLKTVVLTYAAHGVKNVFTICDTIYFVCWCYGNLLQQRSQAVSKNLKLIHFLPKRGTWNTKLFLVKGQTIPKIAACEAFSFVFFTKYCRKAFSRIFTSLLAKSWPREQQDLLSVLISSCSFHWNLLLLSKRSICSRSWIYSIASFSTSSSERFSPLSFFGKISLSALKAHSTGSKLSNPSVSISSLALELISVINFTLSCILIAIALSLGQIKTFAPLQCSSVDNWG